MRIAIVATSFAEYSMRLATALANEHEVLLVLEQESFENEVGDFAIGTGNARLLLILNRQSPYLIVANARRLASVLRCFRPDVVHVQESLRDFVFLALLAVGDVPMVLTIHDPQPHSGFDRMLLAQPQKRVYRGFQRLRCRRAIVHGTAMAAQIERMYPRLRDRVDVIEHGALGPVAPLVAGSWTEGGMLFFGRIEAYKGLRHFIDAIRLLCERGMEVKATVAGRGSDLDKYRNEILNQPGFVVINRYLSRVEVDGLFRSAHVVVLPYEDATQSGVGALAIGYGRPIVASKVGSIGEMVDEGRNGFLVRPGDSRAIADRIEAMLRDPQLTLSMQRHALELAASRFSWPAVAQATVACYRRVVKEMG